MILAWLAATFVAGVWLGSWVAVPVPALAAVAGAAALAALSLWRRRGRMPLLLVTALSLGMARAPQPLHAPTPHQIRFYAGTTVQIDGVVVAEPDVRDAGTNYVVRADRATVRGRQVSVSGDVRVHTARSVQVEYGDGVTVTGHLREPPRGSQELTRQGIQADMLFPRISDRGPASLGWRIWVMRARRALESGIDAWLPEPEAALLIAITLGSRSAALGDLSPILVATGLIHVIAISGIKVALVAGTVYELARRTGGRRLTLALALATLGLYVLLTGATASGERSALMWALVFVAGYLGRGTVALVSLGFAAALMVAVAPTLLWDTAFLMSTVGTLAIVAFAPPLLRACHWIPSPWRESLCVSAAAQAGTLPIVILGFHIVSPLSPLANAAVLPLLPALIATGFVLGACTGFGALAAPLGSFAYVLLHAFIWVARSFARVSAPFTVTRLASGWSALYYLLLAVIATWQLRREGWAPQRQWLGHHREFFLATVVAVFALSGSAVHGPDPASLRWLGSGDSYLLTSAGRTILIDGSGHPYRLLEQLGKVLPYRSHAISMVVVTDPRAPNVAGLEGVLQHYRIQEVLDVGAEYPSLTYAQWRDRLRQAHVPVYALRTGVSARFSGVSIQGLGPDDLCPDPRDCAGLLRLTVAGRSFLFAGAASRREQRETVFHSVPLRSEVLLLDGTQGYDQDFVRAVRPRLVAGGGNGERWDRYMHLRQGIVSTLDPDLPAAPGAPVANVGR